METGVVRFVSGNGGMIVISHGDGFAVVELLGSEGEFSVGDDVRADWSELEGGYISRSGVPERYGVYFQGSWAMFTTAREMASNTGDGF